MTLPTDPLDLTIMLYKRLQHVKVEDGRHIEGSLPAELSYADVVALLDKHNLLTTEDQITRHIEFDAPAFFFLDMDALLSAPSRRSQHPDRFYLASEDFLYEAISVDVPDVIQRYLDATKLYGELQKVADHENRAGSSVSLVFLQQHKLEIFPEFTATQLVHLTKLGDFRSEFIESKDHQQQKFTIVKTVLFELFQGKTRIHFADVLARFDELYQRIHAGYQLYVSEFSFQKVRAEIEKEKLEFTTKLNKVFADIQNQLLAVPAALIIIGGQMETAESWSIKNILIWGGALVFSLLMNLLISNQRHTLRAIKREIDDQWELIVGKHRAVAGKFEDSYRQLNDRYNHQKILLGTVSALVAGALAFSTGMLLWYSVSEEAAIEAALWGAALGIPIYLIYCACLRVYCKCNRKSLPPS